MAEIHFFARHGVFEDCGSAGAARGGWNSRGARRWRCGSRSCAGRSRRSGCAAALHGVENVALADATAGAGAGNLGDVNIVFARDFAHEGRAANFFTTGSCGGLRRGRCCRRCGRFRGRRRSGRGGCGFRRSGRFFGRGWRGADRAVTGFNHRDHRLNRHGLAFADFNFFQHAGRGRGNLRVHLVRGNFEQWFVALDFVSGLLQPLGNGAFENAFAHLGHDDVHSHGLLL